MLASGDAIHAAGWQSAARYMTMPGWAPEGCLMAEFSTMQVACANRACSTLYVAERGTDALLGRCKKDITDADHVLASSPV